MPGMLSYKVNKNKYIAMINDCKEFPGIRNPFVEHVDHGEGIGFILGPGAIRDISLEPPIYYKSYLIDRNFFELAVSGRLPQNEVSSLQCNIFSPGDVVLANELYMIDDRKITEKIELLQDLEFLSNKECLGVKPGEMHLEHQVCIDTFYAQLKYDDSKKVYIVALPWRPNKHLLPSNQFLAFKRLQQLRRRCMSDIRFGKYRNSLI